MMMKPADSSPCSAATRSESDAGGFFFGPASPSIPRKPWKNLFTCLASPPRFPLALSPLNWRSKQKSRRRLKRFCLNPRLLPADQTCSDLKCLSCGADGSGELALHLFQRMFDVRKTRKIPLVYFIYFFFLVLLPDRQCRLDQCEVRFFLKGWLGKCSDLAESQGPILFFFLPFLNKGPVSRVFFLLWNVFHQNTCLFLQNQPNYSRSVTFK